MGDSECRSCPKWKGDHAVELDAAGMLDVRLALTCLRLHKLPSEVEDEPWDSMVSMLPLLESQELRRLAHG